MIRSASLTRKESVLAKKLAAELNIPLADEASRACKGNIEKELANESLINN
jgi:hypothetical protein